MPIIMLLLSQFYVVVFAVLAIFVVSTFSKLLVNIFWCIFLNFTSYNFFKISTTPALPALIFKGDDSAVSNAGKTGPSGDARSGARLTPVASVAPAEYKYQKEKKEEERNRDDGVL